MYEKTKVILSKATVFKAAGIFLISIVALIGCSKKEISNNHEKQAQELQIHKNNTSESNKKLNPFFFSNILSQKQYVYQGTAWGDNVIEGDKPEEMNEDGKVSVTAKLNVSEIAKLSKGKIYELNFTVNGAKNNTQEKSEKIYFWVTEDGIYQFSPPDGFDYEGLVEDGNVNYLECAKMLEKKGQLPSSDKSLIRCTNDNMKFTEGAWETELTFADDTCTYHSNKSDKPDYSKLVWEVGKGLTSYSWGQGALAAGMDLKLVE